jgi:VanZ family protein
MTPTRQIIALTAALVVLAAIFVFGRMPSNTIFWREFENGGHAPLFGCVALVMLASVRLLIARWITTPRAQYLLAFGLASALGIFSEIWQYFYGRDCELRDVLADMAGAAAFLLIWWTIDKAVRSASPINSTRKWSFRSGAVILVLLAYIPSFFWMAVVLHRNAIFPRLAGFDNILEQKLFETRDARLEAVPPPAGWIPAPEGKVGKVTFYPSTYPSLLFSYMYPRWEGYKSLSFDVFSDLAASTDLAFRICDAGSTGCYPDRYNNVFIITPGLNHIELPLDTIALTPSGRHMYMDHTAGMILFLINPTDTTALFVNNFRLNQ